MIIKTNKQTFLKTYSHINFSCKNRGRKKVCLILMNGVDNHHMADVGNILKKEARNIYNFNLNHKFCVENCENDPLCCKKIATLDESKFEG